MFDKANISGHEFLDKIVQLPFAIPELTNDVKKSYLDKIIDEKELDQARVLSRFMVEGRHFLKEEDVSLVWGVKKLQDMSQIVRTLVIDNWI